MKRQLEINVVAQVGAQLPAFATSGAAGADLSAYLPDGDLTIPVNGRVLVPTGLTLEIPPGYEGQVRPRSGLAFKHGVTILNAPGTIDSDYRGEVKVILVNYGEKPFRISHGDRIAQLVIAAYTEVKFVTASELEVSERGEKGFGSTGV